MLLRALAALLLASCPFEIIAAPNASDIQVAANQVEGARSSIAEAARNLAQIRDALAGQDEAERASKIVDEAWLLFETAGRVVVVADIARQMRTEGDRAIVISYFASATKHYGKQVDIDLPYLNQLLVGLRTPAALVEATRIRDKMLEARTALRQFELEQ